MKKTILKIAALTLALVVCLGCISFGFTGCDKKKEFVVDGVTFQYLKKGISDGKMNGRSWSTIQVLDIGDKTEITIPSEYDGNQIEMFLGFDGVAPEDLAKIEKITVSEGITYLFGSSFKDLVNLEEVVLPESLETIADYAFKGCLSLKTLTIPENVRLTEFQQMGSADIFGELKTDCASYCPRLSEIYVKNDKMLRVFYSSGHTAINLITTEGATGLFVDGDYVYCVDINSAMDENQKTVVYLVEYKGDDEIVSVRGSNNLNIGSFAGGYEIKIKEGAFVGNETVKRIIVEEGVTAIGKGAFAGCTALETIELPESLKTAYDFCAPTVFGETEFSGCTALTEIVYAGNYNEWKSLYSWSLRDGCDVECLEKY